MTAWNSTSTYAVSGQNIHGAIGRSPEQAGGADAVETYFECISTCSLDDAECITICTEVLRDNS
jgi:hypothetical protein